MRVAEVFWRPLAWLLSREPIARVLLGRAKRTPYTHIHGKDGSVYMMRWWLFNPYEWPAGSGTKARWRKWLPSARVHWIRRPDDDRALHDHPWNARTIILRGGYVETKQNGEVVRRRAGDTARLLFGEYHRIDYVPEDGALTLFITWRYRGTWGFLVNGQKVPWREYLGRK